jgi:hypothetical protein
MATKTKTKDEPRTPVWTAAQERSWERTPIWDAEFAARWDKLHDDEPDTPKA